MSERARVALSADDYALSDGVSRGILDLAEAGRLSATAVMTTSPDWRRLAAPLLALRDRFAIGLHLNLTAGAPLGPMPSFAPTGTFPGLRTFTHGKASAIPAPEVTEEIARQLDAFEAEAGMPPDFVDGHHHVQIFAPVRTALIAELRRRYPGRLPLVRDPADRLFRILRRNRQVVKALGIAMLARGLGAELAAAGIPSNDGFAGFSDFDRATRFDAEIDSFLVAPGPRHLVMCHPGYPDADLAARDSVTLRRQDEFDAIRNRRDIEDWLWLPKRDASGCIAWWA